MKENTARYAMIINVSVCATVLIVAFLCKNPWALAGLMLMVEYKETTANCNDGEGNDKTYPTPATRL